MISRVIGLKLNARKFDLRVLTNTKEIHVHHTDAEREWAYDRKSKIGHLDKALDEALNSGWTVVDMKNDWKVVYPFQLK
jgi:hypothetical protein